MKVCEAYKKIAASRSKKKSPSKKEKEVCVKRILYSFLTPSTYVPGCVEGDQRQRSHPEAAGRHLRRNMKCLSLIELTQMSNLSNI